MGADPPRATRRAAARGAGPGLVRRRRRRRRDGGAEARGRSVAPACRARLFRPGHGASPPPRHGSPCPCSSPLSERKWPPPPSQRPQPPPPPQQQRGRHLGEAGAGSAPRQETGSGGPVNARREAGQSERGGEPRGHPQRPRRTAAGPAPQVSTAAAAQGRAVPVADCAPPGRGSPLPERRRRRRPGLFLKAQPLPRQPPAAPRDRRGPHPPRFPPSTRGAAAPKPHERMGRGGTGGGGRAPAGARARGGRQRVRGGGVRTAGGAAGCCGGGRAGERGRSASPPPPPPPPRGAARPARGREVPAGGGAGREEEEEETVAAPRPRVGARRRGPRSSGSGAASARRRAAVGGGARSRAGCASGVCGELPWGDAAVRWWRGGEPLRAPGTG